MNTPTSHPEEAYLPIYEKQLERMRSMHYGYYSQFFQATHLFTIIILLNIGISLYAPLRAAVFVIPFFVVYAGFFSAYLLSYNLFARIYATALEKKINQIVGSDILIAHKMEEVYLYATPGPKFVTIDFARPGTFIGGMTISFTLAGILIYVMAAYRSWQLLPDFALRFPPLHLYWLLLGIWTLGHLFYLIWFFVGGGPEKKIAEIVNEAYRIGN